MQKTNPIQEKSYAFAVSIVRFCMKLQENHEYILSKQLLRSGTSVGANIEEAIHAQSKRDFIAKLSIAYKEAHETQYWLRLLRDTGKSTARDVDMVLKELQEILGLLTAIIKTARNALSAS